MRILDRRSDLRELGVGRDQSAHGDHVWCHCNREGGRKVACRKERLSKRRTPVDSGFLENLPVVNVVIILVKFYAFHEAIYSADKHRGRDDVVGGALDRPAKAEPDEAAKDAVDQTPDNAISEHFDDAVEDRLLRNVMENSDLRGTAAPASKRRLRNGRLTRCPVAERSLRANEG